MDFKAALDKIVEQVVLIVSKMLEAAPFDKTYSGAVRSCTKATNSAIYTVGIEINGKVRAIESSVPLKVNSFVRVLVPKNNWNNAQVLVEPTVPYMCDVYYAGSGDTSFTGAIVFNTVVKNIGNCYSTSTGRFTAPVSGIYYASFTFYSNNTATNPRPAIMKNGALYVQDNGSYGKSISCAVYLNAGDYLTAGAYNSSYPVGLYASNGHNRFTVCLVNKY